ncbi:MAG: M20/M25/M40 family metallo-hydrolase [Niabella sp.]
MRKDLLLVFTLFFYQISFAQTTDEAFIKRISDEILTNSQAYENLRVLTKTIGGRLSGSPQMYKAEDWGYALLQNTGGDKVYKQACMVPHWVRGGKDEATAILPANKSKTLDVVALGNSVGSGSKGIQAPVLLVNSFEELDAKKGEAKGKIIFYNYKFNPTFIRTFEAYGDAVKYRGQRGVTTAAEYGAVGVIVRSMSHSTDNVPHTGATHYDATHKKIPAVAVGLQDADWLAARLTKGDAVQARIKTNGHFLPDTIAHNIIAEWRGSEFPDEYITLGGHLDSWDNCEGAHDDGAGVVQTVEVLRALRAVGYKPKRTIRFVLFANEENGGRGGNKYADEALAKKEHHIFAVESDAGGFTPRGFSFICKDSVFEKVKPWEKLFLPYGAGYFDTGEGGVDIYPLHRKLDTPISGFLPDSQRYFDIHHARSDTFEAVNKRELELGAVNIAALIYLVDKYGL